MASVVTLFNLQVMCFRHCATNEVITMTVTQELVAFCELPSSQHVHVDSTWIK